MRPLNPHLRAQTSLCDSNHISGNFDTGPGGVLHGLSEPDEVELASSPLTGSPAEDDVEKIDTDPAATAV